ncbi:MAG: SRPBCC family protein [Myxococcota bacterium]
MGIGGRTMLDEAEAARLERGEVRVHAEPVAGSRWPRLVTRAILAAPAEAAWALVADVERWAEYMPRVREARPLPPDGATLRTRMTLAMPFPLPDLTAVVRALHYIEPGVRYAREWTLESGDYTANDGSWVLVPHAGDAGRSLLTYRIHAAPTMPLPRFVQVAAQERAMPGLVAAMRARLGA